jgi:hypothetical protein
LNFVAAVAGKPAASVEQFDAVLTFEIAGLGSEGWLTQSRLSPA